MFGPILAERTKYPALNEAAWRLFDSLRSAVAAVDERPFAQNTAAVAAWTSAHGIASLLIDGILTEADARGLAEQVLRTAGEKQGTPCHPRESGDPERTGADGSTGAAPALDPACAAATRVN